MMAEIETAGEPQVRYDKIGGWLILVGIGLAATPFLMLFRIVNEVLPVFSPEILAIFTTPGSELYNPLVIVFIFIELIAFILIGLAAIILMVLFLRKASVFPRLYIGYLLVQIAWIIIDFAIAALLLGLIEGEFSSFLRTVGPGVFWAAVWVRYFRVEERVKATFVN